MTFMGHLRELLNPPSASGPPSQEHTRSLWLWIWIAGGLYGFSLGIGRGGLQGVYAGCKFPLVLAGVILGNAFLNTMLAHLAGVNLRFREILDLLLSCFALFSLILASLTPVFLFLSFQLPDRSTPLNRVFYSGYLLTHVGMIALAGCGAHLRLFHRIARACGNRRRAKTVVVLWLCGNLLLGAQLSWNLRPFFGSPNLPVEFVRPNALERNFFEAVVHHASALANPNPKTRHERSR
jgi:hypothetical protein